MNRLILGAAILATGLLCGWLSQSASARFICGPGSVRTPDGCKLKPQKHPHTNLKPDPYPGRHKAKQKSITPFALTTDHAIEIAQRAWGPCDGPITVTRYDEPDEFVLARAPVGVCLDGDPSDNTILVPLVFTDTWETYCSAIVHEDGHLHGYDHSPQGVSIMSPEMDHIWKWCLPKRVWWTYADSELTTLQGGVWAGEES